MPFFHRRPSLSTLRHLRVAGLRRPTSARDRQTREQDVDTSAERTKTTGAGPGRRPTGMPVPIALAAAAVVLGGLAVWFGLEAHALRSGATAQNTALTDNARTSEVNGQVISAVNTLFSYDHRDADRSQRAARNLLTDEAVQQYNDLFRMVRRKAPQRKLVLTTTVTHSGVTTLRGDRAHLLIFADQTNTRTDTGRTTYAGAMLAVDAVYQDGRWKISNIETFDGSS